MTDVKLSMYVTQQYTMGNWAGRTNIGLNGLAGVCKQVQLEVRGLGCMWLDESC